MKHLLGFICESHAQFPTFYKPIINKRFWYLDPILYQHEPDGALKNILTKQLGVKITVDKKRKIYFIDNVKFHFDEVKGLGTFLEVEAIDSNETFTIEQLKEQCDKYFKYFGLDKSQLADKSYSDLVEQEVK